MGQDFNGSLNHTLEKLQTIWTEIGYSPAEQIVKTERAYASIKRKLKELVETEERSKKEFINSINVLGSDVCHLSKCLQMDPNEICSTQMEGDMNMMEMEIELQDKLKILQEEANQRNESFTKLRNEELEFCDELCEDPSEDTFKEVPSLDDIHFKKQIVETLKMQRVQRKKTFKCLRDQIMLHMSQLHRKPSTSFERSIFSEREGNVTLSSNNLKDMKELLTVLELQYNSQIKLKSDLTEEINVLSDRLELSAEDMMKFWLTLNDNIMGDVELLSAEKTRLLEIRNLRMGEFIAKLRDELKEMWEKCYVSEEQKLKFWPMYGDGYNEEVLKQLENELIAVKATYNLDIEIYKKVDKWFVLWNEVTKLEEKLHNPGRLFENRGCSLLQEEKQRKRVNKMLPKTEAELKELIRIVEENGRSFLIRGMELSKFVEQQWLTYGQHKIDEKKERQEAKTKQLEMDARIGTGKVSVKRPHAARNTNQSSKFIKTGVNQRTPVMSATVRSRGSSINRHSSRLFTLRESTRSREPVENTFNSSEVSSYGKFSERLHTLSERENIRSSVLLPNRPRPSPCAAPRGLPPAPLRNTPSTPIRQRSVKRKSIGQRRSNRLHPSKPQMSPSPYANRHRMSPFLSLTPIKNKLSFLL